MLLRTLKRFFSTHKILFAEKVPSTSPNPESKPNLLVVHGVLGTGNLYRHLAQFSQTRKNYNSYLLDLPNHGKSFRTEKISIPQMGNAIANWIKAQHFKNYVTIVAHSLGGRAVISMTHQHPELQQLVRRIILLDAAPHKYTGYPFHKKTRDYLSQLSKINLKTSKQEIQKQIRAMSDNEVQYKMLMNSIDFDKKQWNFHLQAIEKGYDEIIAFGIDSADWKSQIIGIKALKSAFMNDFSKAELKRIYPNVKIQDVDCYHNIQLQKPFAVFDIINKIQ